MRPPSPRIELGHQLYAVLEQCRKPEVLWERLASGNYDSLGVRRNGKSVLGRPRLSAVVAEDTAPPPDRVRDLHRVECLGPLQRVPHWEAFETRAEARDAYLRQHRRGQLIRVDSGGDREGTDDPVVLPVSGRGRLEEHESAPCAAPARSPGEDR